MLSRDGNLLEVPLLLGAALAPRSALLCSPQWVRGELPRGLQQAWAFRLLWMLGVRSILRFELLRVLPSGLSALGPVQFAAVSAGAGGRQPPVRSVGVSGLAALATTAPDWAGAEESSVLLAGFPVELRFVGDESDAERKRQCAGGDEKRLCSQSVQCPGRAPPGVSQARF